MTTKLIHRETIEVPGTVLIDGKPYRYRLIKAKSYRSVALYKGDGFEGEVYEVRAQDSGVNCSCNDYRFRQKRCGGVCKHGLAAVVLAGE